MFSFFYDCIQLVAVLLLLPSRIYGRFVRKDPSLPFRLGFGLPPKRIVPPSKRPVFLIYAVSVGETKAAGSLLPRLRETFPEASVYVASGTVTGREEAKRSLPLADGYFFLPFDLSFLSKRFIRHLKPDVVLVSEGDLWYRFLKEAKDGGALLCLFSAKISEGSFRRFSRFPFVAKRIFSLFSLICAQNNTFAQRFIDLGADPSGVCVTGNVKLEHSPERLTEERKALLRKRLGIRPNDFTVVFGSTHAPEEEQILESLKKVLDRYPRLKCVFVPRHPGRFADVKRVLSRSGIPLRMFSQEGRPEGAERIVCVDVMGILFDLYQIADLAVVGGSFFPFLKGHNIFEPIAAEVPVLFGPYMKSQQDLVEIVLGDEAGIQTTLEELAPTIELLINNPSRLSDVSANGKRLLLKTGKASSSTREHLVKKIDSLPIRVNFL